MQNIQCLSYIIFSISVLHQKVRREIITVHWCVFVIELGMLSGIAAILRFPISDPDDENDDENDNADSSSDAD